MTAVLWQFPVAAKFGRTIPKSKIYQHAKLNKTTKDKIVQELDKIEWAYKLAPGTINLAESKEVPEIQVLRLYLKSDQLSTEVLSVIDAAIPLPIIFELIKITTQKTGSALCYMACHKTPKIHATGKPIDHPKWQCSLYLQSEWVNPNALPPTPLPAVTSLANLYHYFLAELAPIKPAATESIGDTLARIEQLERLNQQIQQLESKQRKEKQFNRQVTLNQEIKALKTQADHLRVCPQSNEF